MALAPEDIPPEVDDAIEEAIAQFHYDPDGWAKFCWDWGHGDLTGIEGPREWQTDINGEIRKHLMNPETRFQPLQIAVSSGHGPGKSAQMGMMSNWAMSCFTDARILCTANTDKQLETKTIPEVSKWFRSAINSHWFDVRGASIKARDPVHRENWRMDFVPWSEHNTEAFAGLHNKGKIILLLFDEASKIADSVWEVAEGALTDENTIIIWIVFGNPTRASGRFRECFRKFRHRWVTRKIDTRNVPGTNKQKIQQWLEDHGEDSDFFKIRVRGEFPNQSAMQFISQEDADKARSGYEAMFRNDQSYAPKIIGVDPAWTGHDTMEIVLRQGLYSKHLRTIPKNDDDVAAATLIARLEDEHHADGVIVDAGYGTGIVSIGKNMGRTWHLVWFGSTKTPDPGCLNMRAYIWAQMRDWIKQGGVIDPKDDVLYEDLTNIEIVERLDGKVQLESKEDMRDRGIPSPGRGDALACTFAVPISKKQKGIAGRARGHVAEYDPYQSIEPPRASRPNYKSDYSPYEDR